MNVVDWAWGMGVCKNLGLVKAYTGWKLFWRQGFGYEIIHVCNLLFQVLPFCSEETLAKLEENILRMQPISDAAEDLSASDIVEALLDGIGVRDYNNSVS